MPRYTVDLSSRAALDPAQSGGKGAGLAWLSRQKVPVPSGYVVTTAAFRDFLAVCGAPRDAEAVLAAIQTTPFPPAIAQAILAPYRKLGGPVAVRSSLTREDALTVSYAGQFTTCLDVAGEGDLLAAVRACWASVFEHNAAAYRAGRDAGAPQDPAGPAMGVVVQRMVPAIAAGIAFSADPISGEQQVVIEAVPGLGDKLAGGRSEADRYVVDARGVLVESEPAVRGTAILSEAQVLRLADTVRMLAARAGTPCDVEWALDHDFQFLQCRPITSLAGRRVYSNRITADMAPGLVKPMVYSTNTLAMAREVFGKLFTDIIGPNDYDFTLLTPRICSRVYADMTLLGELLERAGLPPNFMEVMLRSERADRKPAMRMTPSLLPTLTRMVRLAFRHGRLPRHQAAGLAESQAALAPYRERDWSGAPLDELLARLDELVLFRNRTYWLFFVSMMGMAARNSLLRRWVQRSAGDVACSDLIRGLAGLRSLEPLRELERLGALARRLPPGVRERLATTGPNELESLLAASPEGQELSAAAQAFIDRFGFLSSNGSDFTASTWSERPVLIWQAVSRAGASPDVPCTQPAAATREEARQQVRSRLRPPMRFLFDRLLASIVVAIELREAVSLLMSEYSYQMRRLFLAIGDIQAGCGALGEREDLFYLAYDEMKALAAGTLQPQEARALVAERRRQLKADAAISPPSVLVGAPGAEAPGAGAAQAAYAPGPLEAELATHLSGIAGSSGVVRGRARVVQDPSDAPAILGRGDILVVPFSDVGWTPLFSCIGGIIAETGGQLSHTAIVAREYGIPAVVSVKRATQLIRDGQPLAVDGSLGKIYLEPQPAFEGGEAWIP